MQSPQDADLAAAVESPDRTPLVRLAADWGRDGTYSHPLADLTEVTDQVVIERSLTGDLPDECTLIEGYATAKLSATLAGQRGGDPRDIARLLSPYRADGPLYRQPLLDVPVRADLGLGTTAGPKLLRQFTGSVRRVELSSAERTVELEALDPAERLRVPITLPLAAESATYFYNRAAWPYRYLINTQWVLDYVLRRNGIFFSPPPRPGCLFAMTCHGGLVADIGTSTEPRDSYATDPAQPAFVPGVYGLAANGGPNVHATVYARTAGASWSPGFGPGHLFEFHIKAGGSNTFHPQSEAGAILAISTEAVGILGASWVIGISTTGQLWVKCYDRYNLLLTVNGPRITGAAAWHSVGAWLKYDSRAGTFTHRWHLDGVQTTQATVTLNHPTLFGPPRSQVRVTTALPVQCLQISPADAPPADWGAPHTSQADLDTGLNWMTGLPDLVNADSWQVIKDAVSAEYGVVGFTEAGRFQFRNRDTTRTSVTGPPVRTLTSAVSLANLRVSMSVDSVRNRVTARTTPRLDGIGLEPVWSPATIEELDTPVGFHTRIIQMPRRARLYNSELGRLTPDAWRQGIYSRHSFVPVNAETGVYVDNVTVRAQQFDDESQFELTIQNPNFFPVRFVVDNRPAFLVAGYLISDGRGQESLWGNDTSSARYGRRVLALPDNPFRQQPDAIGTVAVSLLADLAEPVPVLAEVPVVGDPRLQLADPVVLTDPDGVGGPIRASVIGIRRALSEDDGLADSLTLRATPPSTA